MKGLRVAIIGWAGSVHIQRWARGLVGRGFDVQVISLGGEPIDSVVTMIIPRRSRLSYLTAWPQVCRAIAQFKPDLVHAHYATGNGWWGKRTGLHPLVLSAWGSDVIDFPSNWLKRAMVKRILNSADYVTATSQLLKRVCLEIEPGLSERIKVIPFGVDPLEEVKAPPPGGICRFCFVKVHSKKYGPDILLKAVDLARRKVPHIKLSIAGEGEMTPLLKEMSCRLGLEEQVEFVGFIDNRQILEFISDHHFMVMPSTMASESFGVAVLEAAACSRPVIASDIGGVPEVVRPGETGFLVEPGNVEQLASAIVKLAQEKELCQRMGRAARQFLVENYTWAGSLDMMSELYEKLVNQKGTRAGGSG